MWTPLTLPPLTLPIRCSSTKAAVVDLDAAHAASSLDRVDVLAYDDLEAVLLEDFRPLAGELMADRHQECPDVPTDQGGSAVLPDEVP